MLHSLKGNTDTSGLVSGLVPIRLGDCGTKFKNVVNLKAILISSLCAHPEANPNPSAEHPDGFQIGIYHSKFWYVFCKHILKPICINILIPDEIQLQKLMTFQTWQKWFRIVIKICIQTRHFEFWSGLKQLLTWLKVIKILKGKAQDPDAIFDTDKKKPGLNFVPDSPNLIGTSPDTSPDVFPLGKLLDFLVYLNRGRCSWPFCIDNIF